MQGDGTPLKSVFKRLPFKITFAGHRRDQDEAPSMGFTGAPLGRAPFTEFSYSFLFYTFTP